MNNITNQVNFPSHDIFWAETLRFLQKHVKSSHLAIAPDEFATILGSHPPIQSTSKLPRMYDWIVLHKGQLNLYNIDFLKTVEDNHTPVFFNEVFVVLMNNKNENKLTKLKKFIKSIFISNQPVLPNPHVVSFRESLHQILSSHHSDLYSVISDLLLLSKDSQPNINSLNDVVRDLNIIKLNVKNLGYTLAKDLSKINFQQENIPNSPVMANLSSKPTTQSDLESEWVSYWCTQLKIRPIYHRKIWELCYVLQALHEYMGLKPELSGIGFGCGEEPLPSLFASMGINITVTDLDPEKSANLGWVETAQHTQSLDSVYHSNLVDKVNFLKHISLKYVDMNNIPNELSESYNFCWSICALEHLGSVKLGLDFIENSLKVLKPGGVAVHTTEYNYTNHPFPITNWPTVMFQNKDFIEITNRLQQKGYFVAPLNFDKGNLVLDRFIDIPPYDYNSGWISRESWGNINQQAHINLSIDGFPCTCFGIIIKKSLQF